MLGFFNIFTLVSDVENYIYQLEGKQRETMLYLHDILVNDYNLVDKIRFKIPFYYNKTWVCYLNPIKQNKVELAFVRGNELSNHQHILDNKGRKQVYGIEIENSSNIPLQTIREIINEALELDSSTPYQAKNKRK